MGRGSARGAAQGFAGRSASTALGHVAPRALLLAIASLAIFATGCFTTESDEESGSDSGIDREELLGELEEVRDLFAARSPFDPDVLADVSYDDNSLTVTLADDAEGLEDAEAVCDDLGQAIQLPDLSIHVDGPDGTRLASCQFTAVGQSGG